MLLHAVVVSLFVVHVNKPSRDFQLIFLTVLHAMCNTRHHTIPNNNWLTTLDGPVLQHSQLPNRHPFPTRRMLLPSVPSKRLVLGLHFLPHKRPILLFLRHNHWLVSFLQIYWLLARLQSMHLLLTIDAPCRMIPLMITLLTMMRSIVKLLVQKNLTPVFWSYMISWPHYAPTLSSLQDFKRRKGPHFIVTAFEGHQSSCSSTEWLHPYLDSGGKNKRRWISV